MVGRFHYYEGHALSQVIFPIRVMAALGIKILIATNAAGGLNPDYNVGDVMVIEDHISLGNLAGIHPLVGPNLEAFGERFTATSDAYDLELRRTAFKAAKLLPAEKGGLTMHEGIYANVSGPTYETRAECRLLRLAGADAVGMSTIPEVITAKHCGLKTLALSLITNKVVIARQPPSYAPPPADLPKEVHASHEEVLAASASKALLMQDLIRGIFSAI
ncbi:Purine nucleoside phosphorylase [Entomophthora muscae]|uniref:Purine nucleoside phosphorylase n=1 Tax=Entomophthora muscae TaxID=34485 RepID=A0ACC2U700_9FUNG|nr:Purine nucleoside phosphorylase [Entomophthora muscae]